MRVRYAPLLLVSLSPSACAVGSFGGTPSGEGPSRVDASTSATDGGAGDAGRPASPMDAATASAPDAPGAAAGDAAVDVDGSVPIDAPAPMGDAAPPPPPPVDAATMDAATGLDPNLVLPAPGGAACTNIGYQCPNGDMCRIDSTTGGLCEGCTGCSGLKMPCVADVDCDVLFQCYAGLCEPLCSLATPQVCGNPSACTNVGNATTGVCIE
jgi:hypothetical protein